MIVFTLGPQGTYSQQATEEYFGTNIKAQLLPTIPDIFEAVSKEKILYGIVPLENTIEGTVRETYDLLYETDLLIWDTLEIEINHALLAQSPNFSTILSHSQALAQCRQFLRKKYKKKEVQSVNSTAEALAKANLDSEFAAIGNPKAASQYKNLQIIAENINDYTHNTTTFAVISSKPNPKNKEKSIAIITPTDHNEPGLLMKILYPFQEHGVDLTKLESRPNKVKPNEYLFYIEYKGDPRQARIRQIYRYLEKDLEICTIKTIGGKSTNQ